MVSASEPQVERSWVQLPSKPCGELKLQPWATLAQSWDYYQWAQWEEWDHTAGVISITWPTLQVPQVQGLVNTAIIMTGSMDCGCVKSSQIEMDPGSMISCNHYHHPSHHDVHGLRDLALHAVLSWWPQFQCACLFPLPGAVLVEACNARECAWDDWWSLDLVICSLEGTVTQFCSATSLTLTIVVRRGQGRCCSAYISVNQKRYHWTSSERFNRNVMYPLDGSLPAVCRPDVILGCWPGLKIPTN